MENTSLLAIKYTARQSNKSIYLIQVSSVCKNQELAR